MQLIARTSLCAAPLAFLNLVACNAIYLSDSSEFTPNTVIPSVAATSVAQYRAYGDSITFGATLADPLEQAHPSLVSEFENVTLANNAISGDMACDIPKRQIFSNADSPTLVSHPMYTLLIGTNDVDVMGEGAYESIYMLCHKAAIAWLAIPVEYKVLANGNGVTTTGPGMLDTSNNWNAWTTERLGSTVSFSITTTMTGPIYVWPRIDDANTATYSYSLDGVVIGTSSMQTTPRMATRNGTTSSLGFLRLPPVPAGKHVVTFVQTSTGAQGLSVVGIGRPTGPATDILPSVLVGTIPYQLHGASGGACTSDDDPCLEYIRDIEADVNLIAADGLKVRLFDTRKYMFGTIKEMSDALHPNALGQFELSQSVEASWY